MPMPATGASVPLSTFTRYEYSLVQDRVRHRSQFAAENVGFGLAEDVSIEQALTAIDGAMARIMLPTDIQVRLSGSAQNFQKTLQSQPLLILGVLVAELPGLHALADHDGRADPFKDVEQLTPRADCAAGHEMTGEHSVHDPDENNGRKDRQPPMSVHQPLAQVLRGAMMVDVLDPWFWLRVHSWSVVEHP